MTNPMVLRETSCVAGTPSSRLLRRIEASAYLTNNLGIPRTANTLAKLAVIGGGPSFRKAGRIPLYAIEDLDAWARLKLSPRVTSTSHTNVR